MPVSAPQSARRAFVKLLITVAAIYSVILEGFSRESSDKAIEKVYRKVIIRAHPDKGGSKEHMQKLLEAKDAWHTARDAKPGRPSRAQKQQTKSGTQGNAESFVTAHEARKTTGYRQVSQPHLVLMHQPVSEKLRTAATIVLTTL